MKKIIALFLLIYMHTSAADVYKLNITPHSKFSTNTALTHWKFRSVHDQIIVNNSTDHPIKIMFYLNGKVIDDTGVLHVTDKVSVSCNKNRTDYQVETTVFCEIKPG